MRHPTSCHGIRRLRIMYGELDIPEARRVRCRPRLVCAAYECLSPNVAVWIQYDNGAPGDCGLCMESGGHSGHMQTKTGANAPALASFNR